MQPETSRHRDDGEGEDQEEKGSLEPLRGGHAAPTLSGLTEEALEGVQAVAQLQEGEAKTTRAQLLDRECQNGPQQQHVWFNVEKTFAVTGTRGANPTGRAAVVGLG